MRRVARKSGWRQTQPDPAAIGPMLRAAGFIGSEADPVRVRASFDDQGRPRRVHARYADGWTCIMHLSADRTFTLSQTLRIRVTGGKVSV